MPANRLERPIPARALVLAGMSLLVPVAAMLLDPLPGQGADTLLWFAALIPAFVLSYYRGWLGSSAALAAGMVALSTTNLAVVTLGLPMPDWGLLSAVVVAYVALTLGIGWLSDGLHRDREEAESMAMTDALTGLANRRFAERMLDQAVALAERGMPISVVMFDVDHFKAFNDEHGHVAGDEVLEILGGLLDHVTRRSDLAARHGGEEFLCLLHNCGSGGALTFVGRVRDALQRAEFPGGGVTMSAGVACWDGTMRTAQDLVSASDTALYAAKAAGRDCTRVAGGGPDDRQRPGDPMDEQRRREPAAY